MGPVADGRTFIDALRRLEEDRDPEPLAALFAEDATCDNITQTRPFEGRDGAREFWSQDRALFGEIRSEFHAVVAEDGRVALEWTRTGTSRDGDDVRYEGVSVFEVRDGRITRFKAYFDPARLGRQAM